FYPYAYPLLQEAAQLRRAGLASSSIAARLGEMVDARWQGVGRNDKCVCGSGRKAKACCWYRRP
ncbi:MAG: SEC-C metal-binding domain-containing protein, partial [Coriobacteriia bacterium]|nr:SEC-C metal-binding domain-containing protein [Coriobacteriia bacterium]